MAITETGYMIVRDDYSTFTTGAGVNPTSVPPGFYPSKDATPGNSIDDTFTFTIRLPDGSTESVTEHYWFGTWSDLVQVCNVIVQHHWPPADRSGQPRERLVQVSYTNPDDTAVNGNDHPPPISGWGVAVLTDPTKRAIVRCDIVSEIDAATIIATATV